MPSEKLKRKIAFEAARLLFDQQESLYVRAKLRAARHICRGWIAPAEFPTDREIRDQIRFLARLAGNPGQIASTTWAEDAHDPADCKLLAENASAPPADSPEPADADSRFAVYRSLLLPLATVQQSRERHPEGDALYHSLQVFERAREARPYDQELLEAALLHDVGKAIDPYDHVAASLAALAGYATPRTLWFIEQHIQAQALFEGTLGARARRRLEASSDYDDLLCLAECDRAGRVPGAQVCDVDQALAFLEELEQTFC